MPKFLPASILCLLLICCTKRDKFEDLEYIMTYNIPFEPYRERIDHFFTTLSEKKKINKKEEEILVKLVLHEILWERYEEALTNSKKVLEKSRNSDFVSYFIFLNTKQEIDLPSHYIERLKEHSWEYDIVFDKELVFEEERRPWVPWMFFYQKIGEKYILKNEVDFSAMLEHRIQFSRDFGFWDKINWYNFILGRHVLTIDELHLLYSHFLQVELRRNEYKIEPLLADRIPDHYATKLSTLIHFYKRSVDLGDDEFSSVLQRNIQDTVKLIESNWGMSSYQKFLVENMKSYNKTLQGMASNAIP